jgi:hypothetical protein
MTHEPVARRESPAWLKLSIGTTLLLGGMLLVMWAQQRPEICAVSEAPRTLQLDRTVDREHLAADGARAVRMARRHMMAGASADEQQRLFLECDALLVRAIAATHGMSVEQVEQGRASATP